MGEHLESRDSLPLNAKTITHPPMIIRTVAAEGFCRANDEFLSKVGFTAADLGAKEFVEWIVPEDLAVFQDTLAGKISECQVRHKTRLADPISLHIRVTEQGDGPVVLGRFLEGCPTRAGSSSRSTPLDEEDEATVSGTLHTIARIVEEQNPGYKCSILLVADGRFVRGAGPSLPEEYNAAIDGFAVGPTVGSCGTAIFWNVPVIVEDIQADPLWAPFAELAKRAGVASCWSHPFQSKTGNVLGALAFYSPEPKAPTAEQLLRLRAAAKMTGLAVERGRAEEALRTKRQRELELEEQLRQSAKMEALGVLAGGLAHDFNNILATILSNAELARDLSQSNPDVKEMLSDIVDASKRAGEFCLQLLSYAGRGSLTRTEIEIGALIPEVSKLVQAAISKKTVLKYSLPERPIHIVGDENQLVQVLMNVITNAAHAIGESEGEIVVSTEAAVYDEEALEYLSPKVKLTPGEYVRLNICDTGSGMDEATVQ
ncbi:MAG: GAF domain-containing protein, partial [Bdellovibrionales bacterium]|nr:GAF domain-containing protein [Bdellovibrionales bacterium]